MREKEAGERGPALTSLQEAIEKYNAFAASQSEDYAHIGTEEKQKVAAECAQAQAWKVDAEAKLAALGTTDDPPIKAAEIAAKASSLAGICAPIMNTPKPLPPPPEPEPAAEAPPADEAAEAAPAADSEPPPPSKPDNMDVD